MMKYISPGSWFSLELPAGWHEFEDAEDSFLFTIPKSGVEISVFQLTGVRAIHMLKNVLPKN